MGSGAARRGLSIIEVLVVIAIIAILMGLLLPAVQASREAARRSQCFSHFSQMGLAQHNYAAAHGVLPPGRLRGPWDGHGRTFSGYAYLLPYREQQALSNAINFQLDSEVGAANRTARGSTMFNSLCPSDLPTPDEDDSGMNNYLLNTGNTPAISPRNPAGFRVTGVYFENSAIRFEEIRDGTAHTVAEAETVRSRPGPGTWKGRGRTGGLVLTRGSDDLTLGPELVDPATQCRGVGLLLRHERGASWLHGAPGQTMYNHLRPPNDPEVDCRGGLPQSDRTNADWDRLSHDVAPRSRHPGGVAVGFCDGSYRFIKETINPTVWRALGSRAGGEEVPNDY